MKAGKRFKNREFSRGNQCVFVFSYKVCVLNEFNLLLVIRRYFLFITKEEQF